MKEKGFESFFKWGLVFLIGLAVLICFPISKRICFSFIEWVSLIGSYSSVFGLIVMIIQFRSVKQTALETKDTINHLLFLTDWTKYSELSHSAQDDIRRDDLSLARYKIQSIKQSLMGIPDGVLLDQDKKTKQGLVKKIYKHISLIDTCMLNDLHDFSKETIISDLEEVADYFLKMVNQNK